MAKTVSLGIRIEPDLKAELDKAAREENRSVANLVETVLRQWLNERYPKIAGGDDGPQ